MTARRLCYYCRTKRAHQLLLLLLLLVPLALILLHYFARPLIHRRLLDPIAEKKDDNTDAGLAVLDISMPNPTIGSNFQDAYLCTAHRLPNDSATMYIVRFEPRGSLAHVHHMLLAVCDELPSTAPRWNCGGMSVAVSGEESTAAPMEMCTSGLRYLYAYAMHAPPLRLPEGVAFPVGGGRFGGRHLVLQVHYTLASHEAASSSQPPDPSLPQTSGIRLGLLPRGTQTPRRLAGVHLSATGGLIPARSVTHLSAGCPYTGDAVLHPFAFRVHTHQLGRVVSVYRVSQRYRDNGGQSAHKQEWTLIGRANPQLAQMFYPVNSTLTLTSGDCVAALCVMENQSDRLVRIGPTARDEMCNAYVMYWYPSVEQGDWQQLHHHGCMSKGYSDIWWEAPQWVVKQVSSIPGSGRYLPQTESS